MAHCKRCCFQEGQDVKAGDVLAIIDPRPFQAALDQAVATKAKDEAQLANARWISTAITSSSSTNAMTKQQRRYAKGAR